MDRFADNKFGLECVEKKVFFPAKMCRLGQYGLIVEVGVATKGFI